jgi:hypothetical protein
MDEQRGMHDRRHDAGIRTQVAAKPHAAMDLEQCINNCLDCHETCRETVTHCLTMGGRHAQPDHIWLMLNCAEMCLTSAHFMMSNSPLHSATCRACADVCIRCAEDCERFGDDREMQACAEACRQCAESCRRMAMA